MSVIQKTTNDLLAEREKTHGSFHNNAQTFQNLMLEMTYSEEVDRVTQYTPVQKLALTQICLKLARIKQNPQIPEHWKDIAGYVQLVVNDLEF